MHLSARHPHRAVCLALATQLTFSGPVAPIEAAGTRPTDDPTLAHVLNRVTFGARPADISHVRDIGLNAWLDSQLAPATSRDEALEARLATLSTLSLSTRELREKYEIPPNLRQQIQKARAELDAAADQAAPTGSDPSMSEGEGRDNPMTRRAEREEMIKRFPELARLQGPPVQVISELQAAKVLRAVFAERQLEEVMVDFWFNHFNVFARKGPIQFMAHEYEQTLRRHALGRFEDLLVETARSPAMLFYLDNWQSTDPNFSPRSVANRRRSGNRTEGMGRRPGGGRRLGPIGGTNPGPGGGEEQMSSRRRTFGINENYARELMELHTLGVDGGYTQADVVEVARAFTGWTIVGEGPGGPIRNREARFGFEEARHVKGNKKVLGVTIKNGGEKEGLEILHRLATHPSTAKFIATKLARRFVTDTPPEALVLRAAATFEKTGGDIREVLRTILTSDEFLGPAFRAAKVKTPFEFVVSAVRTTGARVVDARGLAQRIADMGMPLYLQQPPTGYQDTAEEWISTSALLERMNFALDLSAGRVRGVRLGPETLGGERTLESIAARILPEGLSVNTRSTLESEAEKEDGGPARLVGLVLGSPEFQRR